ncbi:MAG: ribosome biogenesis factor YjgA [Pseudomonadota bacterium]|nr:ribosome biogenesis factor YjgA [Pseudomonadota bacterium]
MDELNDPGEDFQPEQSKSEIKRELLALHDLAERMIALPRAELERLDLSDAAWAALDETPRIKDLRARRRHVKRIAKLLAREDATAVRSLIGEKAELAQQAAARHHRVERWRERLIAEGDQALTELLNQFPGADRQQLRQLVRAAQRDREKGRPDAQRKLFRFLRGLLDDADA